MLKRGGVRLLLASTPAGLDVQIPPQYQKSCLLLKQSHLVNFESEKENSVHYNSSDHAFFNNVFIGIMSAIGA